MRIPTDKLKHFVVGAIVAGTAAATAQALGLGPGPMAAAGLFSAIVAGVGRELWQRATGRGVPSLDDALTTIAGGALVSAASLVVTP